MSKVDRTRPPRNHARAAARNELPVTPGRFLKIGLLVCIPFLLAAAFMLLVPVTSPSDPVPEDLDRPTPTLAAGPLLQDDAYALFPRVIQNLEKATRELKERTGIRVGLLTTANLPGGLDSFSMQALARWSQGPDDKGILLIYAPGFRQQKLGVLPAFAPLLDSGNRKEELRAAVKSMEEWNLRDDPNGAVLEAVERIIQVLDPDSAGPVHTWDPNVQDTLDFKSTLDSRPVRSSGPPTFTEPPRTHPLEALMMFALCPLLLASCWMVAVRMRMAWLLLPAVTVIGFFFLSIPMGIVAFLVGLFGIIAAVALIHGSPA